ncbi:3-methyladenine DNA glycosylase [Pseudonocardia endophytica]|nr:3-methyladenine DNA glycosylase [Pseudonocardia endophytica]
MGRWTAPHRERRRRGEAHPVRDFLFTYYSHRPAKLEQWDPGPGVRLLGDASGFLDRPGYRIDGDAVVFDPDRAPDRLRATAGFLHGLLTATASRAPRLGCFGLHEWAMVYRTDAPRHGSVPLRLGAAGTDAVVEELDVHCTHYDAFRFFTEAARPHNALEPTRERQTELEQPGCLHATMDLYKWAYKLAPACPSELVGDCFALAHDVRELDMRASPYDLAAHGYAPVPIETPAGRAEYVRAQAGFAGRAAPLRARLIDLCELLLRP